MALKNLSSKKKNCRSFSLAAAQDGSKFDFFFKSKKNPLFISSIQ